MSRSSGFTLIEVLIALTIVAIGLGAALRASSLGSDGVTVYRRMLLAGWVAENQAAERAARRDWPGTGASNQETTLGGERFVLREQIKATANPRFRRVDIEVVSPAEPGHVLRHLTVFLTSP
jgi:general secretion pathway protein I